MAKKNTGGWAESIKTVVYAGLIAIGIRTVAFEPFNIPSGSMIPTLLVGDYLFVSKYSYGYSRYSMPFAPDLFEGRIIGSVPKRGDVAGFRPPPHQRRPGEARAARALHGRRRRASHDGPPLQGNPTQRRVPRHLGDVGRHAARQHAGVPRPRGPRLRHGRQPRQQPGQPGAE